MEIHKVQINELISPDYNPRTITSEELEKLKDSLEEFGYISPLIVNKHNNHIVGGNQRYLCLKEMGYTEIDVIYIDEPDIQREKALNIRLNNLSGEWDTGKLESIFNEFESTGFNSDITGFTNSEITGFNNIERERANDESSIISDDYEEPDDFPVTVEYGEIYQLGNHRLMCGDSTKEKDVILLVDDNLADMVFTDPEYDMDDEYSQNIFNNTKSNAEIFIMHNERKLAHLIVRYDSYFRRLFAVDFKVARLINSNAPMTQVDYIGHFRRDSPSNFNNLNDRFSTLIESSKTSKADSNNFNHKHAKNIFLPVIFIKHFTSDNEIVMDLFGGSGTTLIACEQTNRKCYMMELDPYYCQVIINRWEEFTGKKAVKINQ